MAGSRERLLAMVRALVRRREPCAIWPVDGGRWLLQTRGATWFLRGSETWRLSGRDRGRVERVRQSLGAARAVAGGLACEPVADLEVPPEISWTRTWIGGHDGETGLPGGAV